MNLTDKHVIRNPKIAWQRVDEKYVLVSPKTKKIHVVSGSGARLWELLEKPKSEQDLLGLICEEFDVDQKQARADISEFISKLEKEGIIEIEA